MSLENILARLNKVKKSGKGYIACCPAHEDKSPSMVLKDDDGTVLIHCFAGCGIDEIMGAIGMDASELFPPKESHSKGIKKAAFNPYNVLEALMTELTIVTMYAGDLKKGKEISKKDYDRFLVAVTRIESARRLCNGSC